MSKSNNESSIGKIFNRSARLTFVNYFTHTRKERDVAAALLRLRESTQIKVTPASSKPEAVFSGKENSI